MSKSGVVSLLGLFAALLVIVPLRAGAVEQSNEEKWYFSPSIGRMDFEGDQAVKDGLLLNVRIGYDHSEWWTFEGGLYVAPKLDEQTVGVQDPETGKEGYRISILEQYAGEGVHNTWAVGVGVDALFHFTRWERLDPYLVAGAGFTYFDEDIKDGKFDPHLRYGGGVMWHFNDEWAVRADFRGFFAGKKDIEANSLIDAGVVWNWGAGIPPIYKLVGGPNDYDGDGLTNSEEDQYGTDKWDPDSDRDGLTDGEEVKTYHTDPKNPDTDLDLLKDGEEVKKYKTDPLKMDTDNGGVADGHEVIEDGTDPLNGKDDLMLITLNMEFDYDKTDIKSQYFKDLDVIAKVMKRHPGSTGRIEGHCDQTKQSEKKYNDKLSQRRAEAVLEYLATKGGLSKKDLTAHGYGFSRPKEKPDLKNGNPKNRRVEIYLKGVRDAEGKAPVLDLESAPKAEKAVEKPAAKPTKVKPEDK